MSGTQKPIRSRKSKSAPAQSSKSAANQSDKRGLGLEFWKQRWISGLVLLILPFILYFQATSFGYVLDDKIVLSENTFVRKGTKGLKEIFSTESFMGYFGKETNLVAGARYRPLSIATFALEQQYFGAKPALSHGINILLYALTGLLIYRLFFMLAPPPDKANAFLNLPFIGSLLFLLHPLHTEVVANIKGRDEILALLFSLGSLYMVMRYLKTEKFSFLVATPILFFLALLAKENALTFLAIIPLVVGLFMKTPIKKITMVVLPLIGVFILFVAIRTAAIGFFFDSGEAVTDLMNNPFVDATTGQKYATISYTIGWYLKLLFIPHPLTHDYYPYHVPLVGWGDYRALISIGLVVGLLALAIWAWKRSKITSFSILYFFATLSIVSNAVFSVGTFMNERFLYMPSLGFCFLLAHVLTNKLPQWLSVNVGKTIGYGLVSLIAIGFTVRTVTRVPVWENTATLEAASILVSTNSARSNQFSAYLLYEKSLKETDPVKQKVIYDEAWPLITRSLEIYPTYYEALNCRAGLAASYYVQDGDIGKLLSIFENTLRTKPVEYVDQCLPWLIGRGEHVAELLAFFHRVGYEYFWLDKKDKVLSKKYLELAIQLAPTDSLLNADLNALKGS